MKEIFTAKTKEEAIALAAEKFGTAAENLEIEIIEEPKKGLFGKLKGEAKISASYEPTKMDVAVSYIKKILKNMDIDGSVTAEETENGAMIEISGEDVGAIIGRRGETLDALQYLSSMVANRNDKEYYRITVDSCGYREKRKETLEELAVKIAKSVQKNGRTSALEPMNPYERRIIHSAVSTIEGVTSRSVGEEPYRKVIISSTTRRPEREDRPRRGGGRNGGERRPKRNPQGPRSLDLSTSFEKDYKKPKPEDSMKSELYGKITLD